MTDNQSESSKVFDSCPHCGHKLTPWQQVLLSVDRALVCKNCWYRIIFDVRDDIENQNKINIEKKKEQGS